MIQNGLKIKLRDLSASKWYIPFSLCSFPSFIKLQILKKNLFFLWNQL